MSGATLTARPGIRLGHRPERPDTDTATHTATAGRRAQRAGDPPGSLILQRSGAPVPATLRAFRASLVRIHRERDRLAALTAEQWQVHRQALVAELHARRPAYDTIVHALAAVAHASSRTLDIAPRDEQLFATFALLQGQLVEMQTGEGKSLCAALAATIAALCGTPVHVITVNDYLVERDASWHAPLFGAFGLRVGQVLEGQQDATRRAAWACPIAYCTHQQLIFDYLRDLQTLGTRPAALKARLGSLLDTRVGSPLLRGLCFAIVDEADSVLIDDARTPLILAELRATDPTAQAEAVVALGIARTLHEGVDFVLQQGSRTLWLTDDGRDAIQRQSASLEGIWQFERYRQERITQALHALHLLQLDQHYLVRDGKLALIDEATGRLLPDRRLQHGLQQILEVKEHCKPSSEADPAASITIQRFFSRYCALCGMSSTLSSVRRELRTVYGLDVVTVPTHQPDIRRQLPTLVSGTRERQFALLLASVRSRHARGQPVLIGTRSVAMSDAVSQFLDDHDLAHQLLNAREAAAEAVVIGRAGSVGAITVATNMAGRGTDIPLAREAAQQGGLCVINLQINDSGRVDRQLFGRAARQGDPGVCQSLLTLEDALLLQGMPGWMHRLARLPLAPRRSLVRLIQWLTEQQHARQRRAMFRTREQCDRQLALTGSGE